MDSRYDSKPRSRLVESISLVLKSFETATCTLQIRVSGLSRQANPQAPERRARAALTCTLPSHAPQGSVVQHTIANTLWSNRPPSGPVPPVRTPRAARTTPRMTPFKRPIQQTIDRQSLPLRYASDVQNDMRHVHSPCYTHDTRNTRHTPFTRVERDAYTPTLQDTSDVTHRRQITCIHSICVFSTHPRQSSPQRSSMHISSCHAQA